MRRSSLSLTVAAFVAVLCAYPAMAQETDDNGRYKLYPGAVESGNLGSYPVLLDTQYGRTWILVQDRSSGYVWRRVPILKLKPLNDDLLGQPNPASREPSK